MAKHNSLSRCKINLNRVSDFRAITKRNTVVIIILILSNIVFIGRIIKADYKTNQRYGPILRNIKITCNPDPANSIRFAHKFRPEFQILRKENNSLLSLTQ